ncbi:ABC transporter permease [Ancylobacter sp. Lp-2]|uniref:ABC transporter permease n=1 Tax=Ancylobacter sp. Lp-2 TaxID=2881339 RepID=UPI001E61C2AA|nr:ABC transporter permease [Ancylobacter sp. Lp-2]MCB4768655.1 ABC transporter permease [Ancylobacter sp. Lp-2]
MSDSKIFAEWIAAASVPPARPRRSGTRAFLARLPRAARVAALVLLVYALVSALAPWLAPFSPAEIFVGAPFEPPSATHFLGTDALGRDVFSRVLYGGRTALLMAGGAALLTTAVGGALGLVLSYCGGLADEIGMRFLEVLASIPSVILALLVVGALGPSIAVVVVTVGLLAVPSSTRVVRAAALAFVAEDFVLAARARGEGRLAIALREILPNVAGTLLVEFSIRTGWAVILIGALAFLGFGAPPPTPDWGAMINEGRGGLDASIWPVVAPAAAIAALVLTVNLLTDGIARALGPAR